MSNRIFTTTLASLLTVAAVHVAAPATADAGVRIRASGSVNVRVGRPSRPRPQRPVRPRPRPSIHVGGSIRVGGWVRFGNPPPPPVYVEPCDCGPTRVYPPPASIAYTAPRPALPRWGLGVFAGGMSLENQTAGSDYGVTGRLRLTPGLLLDGEIAKSQIDGDATRVDRRLAAGLTYEFSPYRNWSPYVTAAIGAIDTQIGDNFETSQAFSEIGLGLRVAVTPSIALFADLRGGSRVETEEDVARPQALRTTAPQANQSEEYTSGRIGAMLYF